MSTLSTPKTQTAGSQTWGSGFSDSARGPALRRRRTKMVSEKKIADDEFMAAAIGDVEWLKQSLRDAGPDINFDKNGLTAIHLAAIHGRLECLKVCIEKFKIDINLPSSTGWRAVHLCISNQTGKRSLQCLAYLLEKSADHSLANDDGITPVHQAASEGHVQCLKMLLEVGARLDKQDCRGNTPLDLAKLWGHRKCARILAAEMWHQDKDNVAKEMQQLKKVKMQQVLKELEDEEEMKAARQFYGEEAFNQWMTSKSLTETIPNTLEKAQGKQSNKDSGYKPNSVARKKDASKPLKISTDARKISERSFDREDFPTEISDEELLRGLQSDSERDKQGDAVTTPKKMGPPFFNDKEWNKSTKAPESTYITNLTDDFPRDEYTMMPQVKGIPKFYEGKFVRPITPNTVDEDIKRRGSQVKLRRPRLPNEVIRSVLAKDSSAIDRGMIFKCKHIGDVHTKKKYEVDEKGRPEAPLHLSNDVRSQMVQNSVRFLHAARKSSNSKSDSSRTKMTGSEWMTDTFPLPMVMQTLKQMSKPAHFPNSHGNEYVFAFSNVK
ncbi:ankyrin repeat and KH domain-containing protein mask isoform X2 [Aplysia californica]|nr:ankyrin repeat and KH domain-containing protein mask isoform X2 [Aplysia californica]